MKWLCAVSKRIARERERKIGPPRTSRLSERGKRVNKGDGKEERDLGGERESM